MTRETALWGILVGSLFELAAIFTEQFYWLKGATGQGRPMPLWLGRLFFGVIGALFILAGFRYFFLGY
jgi:hypothetical protein